MKTKLLITIKSLFGLAVMTLLIDFPVGIFTKQDTTTSYKKAYVPAENIANDLPVTIEGAIIDQSEVKPDAKTSYHSQSVQVKDTKIQTVSRLKKVDKKVLDLLEDDRGVATAGNYDANWNDDNLFVEEELRKEFDRIR